MIHILSLLSTERGILPLTAPLNAYAQPVPTEGRFSIIHARHQAFSAFAIISSGCG
jgi:hypothetical protein